MTAWILALMLHMSKAEAPSKFATTYEETATAIADESAANPLPFKEDAVRKTAALIVVWSWYESRYDQKARGDKDGSSYCLMQINRSNFKALGIKDGEELFDPHACIRVSLVLMRQSFRTCAGHPFIEQGAQYASGGGTCEVDKALALSRWRLSLVKRLYTTFSQ